MAISKPDPIYPPIAKAAHVQGAVILHAIISKQGTIENLVIVSGPPTTATLSVPIPAMMQAVGSSPSVGSAAATPIGFFAYFKVGLPLTLVTLAFGTAWLVWT